MHLAADVPKKVEKTSSENITFENSEHPYRTSGPSAASFDFLRSLFFDQKLIIPLRTSPKKSKKRQAKNILLQKSNTPIALAALAAWFSHSFPFGDFFKKYRRFDPLAQNRWKTYHSVADVPKKVEKTSSENTTFVNLEHPYRTSGLSAGSFASIVGATCCYLLLAATICYYLVLFAS